MILPVRVRIFRMRHYSGIALAVLKGDAGGAAFAVYR